MFLVVFEQQITGELVAEVQGLRSEVKLSLPFWFSLGLGSVAYRAELIFGFMRHHVLDGIGSGSKSPFGLDVNVFCPAGGRRQNVKHTPDQNTIAAISSVKCIFVHTIATAVS